MPYRQGRDWRSRIDRSGGVQYYACGGIVNDAWNEKRQMASGRSWERGDCNYRVLRGGSWFSHPRTLRSANRDWVTTDIRSHDYGFRIARSLP